MYTLDVSFVPNICILFFVQQLKWESDETARKGELRSTNQTTLVSSREEINSGFKCIDEGIHLIFRIVEVKTCTSTCSDTKGPMQNLCTMMPWSNCYAMLKQKVTKSILN